MATYGSLLIDAGGGVVNRNQQSDRQPGATVIIGLGGTGKDAVRTIKRAVHKQIKPDDVDAVIPEYKSIRYLIIDSDDSHLDDGGRNLYDIDKSTEFFSIANPNIKDIFKYKTVLKGRHDLAWLNYENISIDDASAGAGGIRQVGRFLLIDKAAKVYQKIKDTIEAALTGVKEGDLTIHICSGISGGTGSGTFLDVCYLVRAVLLEIGRTNASVCGYFFLPDVNLSVPDIAASDLASKYIAENGFAALKELDYCMNFGKNRDSFKMNYGFKEVDDEQQPVDLCYLISTTNQNGARLSDGYSYAMNVVSDFIINFLAKIQPPAGVDAEQAGMTLKGHISNLNRLRSQIVLQHGANLNYSILGASVAEMPLSDIATYLGYKLFESYADIYEKMPTEKERDDFLQATQLKYTDIRKALSKGCVPQIDFPARLDARAFREHGNGRFVEFADEYLAKNKGILEKNSKTFQEQMKDYTIPKESTSLISRTYKGLCEKYLTQLEYGPFYAQRMICGSQNQNLVHAVDGFIKENQTNLEAELRQADRRDDEYNEALAKMQSANWTNERKRMEEYLNALNNLYVHHYKVSMLQTMNSVLQEYKRQLVGLNNNLFNVLTTVLDTLKSTFEENGKVLTEGVKTKSSYTWKILSIPEIQEMLDEEVTSMDLQQTLDELMTTMLDNCETWIQADENKIGKMISEFVLKAFSNATQKTITDYLKVKYNVENVAVLAKQIEGEILKKQLEVNSTPLFWKNARYGNAMGMRSTLTVPYDAAEIKQAAYSYQTNKGEFAILESGINDKISMMRFYSGIPMYAYQAILELQEKYEAKSTPGRHLFEKGEMDWNLWLPSPIPASFQVGTPIKRIENRNEKLIAEFKKAEELEIVKENELGYWEIMTTDEFDVNAYVQDADIQPNGKIDINKLETLIASLEQKSEQMSNIANAVRIGSLDANQGSERQVMLDFYLESPVMNNMVKRELQKREMIINEVAKLREQYKIEIKSIQKSFFNAIFTGVLFYGNTITYTYDEFGIEKTLVLQDNDMENGDTGAYCAYLSYIALPENIKNNIDKLAKSRMNEEDCPEVKEAIQKLDESMEKRIARYQMLHDEEDPIHEELKKFYGEFMKAFQTFKLAF